MIIYMNGITASSHVIVVFSSAWPVYSALDPWRANAAIPAGSPTRATVGTRNPSRTTLPVIMRDAAPHSRGSDDSLVSRSGQGEKSRMQNLMLRRPCQAMHAMGGVASMWQSSAEQKRLFTKRLEDVTTNSLTRLSILEMLLARSWLLGSFTSLLRSWMA